MKSQLRTLFLVLAGFGIYYALQKLYFKPIKEYLDGLTHDGLASYILTYLLIGIPIIIATKLIRPNLSLGENFGLRAPFLTALGWALFFALPMLLGGLVLNGLSDTLVWRNVVAGTLIAALVEEIYFRGFLFGMLYKYTKAGFLTAIIFGAVIFALGHLYQSNESMEMLGIFGITFMGAGLYAWLYVEWDYNLWVPIFLHTFMNLAWTLSDMGDSALGGLWPNILRAGTITLSIVGTLIYKKKTNKPLKITKHNLFIQTES